MFKTILGGVKGLAASALTKSAAGVASVEMIQQIPVNTYVPDVVVGSNEENLIKVIVQVVIGIVTILKLVKEKKEKKEKE